MSGASFNLLWVALSAVLAYAAALSNEEALDGYIAGWHTGKPGDIKVYQAANYSFHFHGVTPAKGISKDGFEEFFTNFRNAVAGAGGPAGNSTDFMRTYGTVRQSIGGYTLETGAFIVPGYGSGTYHALARDGLVELEEAVAFVAGVECLSGVPLASLPDSSAPRKAPAVAVNVTGAAAGEAAEDKLQSYLAAWGPGNSLAIHTQTSPSYRFFFAGFTAAEGVNRSGFEAFFKIMRESIATGGGPAANSSEFMQIYGDMNRTLSGRVGGSFVINSGAFVVTGFGTGVYHAIGDETGVWAENAVAFDAGLECMHNTSTAPETTTEAPVSVGGSVTVKATAQAAWQLAFASTVLMSMVADVQ